MTMGRCDSLWHGCLLISKGGREKVDLVQTSCGSSEPELSNPNICPLGDSGQNEATSIQHLPTYIRKGWSFWPDRFRTIWCQRRGTSSSYQPLVCLVQNWIQDKLTNFANTWRHQWVSVVHSYTLTTVLPFTLNGNFRWIFKTVYSLALTLYLQAVLMLPKTTFTPSFTK